MQHNRLIEQLMWVAERYGCLLQSEISKGCAEHLLVGLYGSGGSDLEIVVYRKRN